MVDDCRDDQPFHSSSEDGIILVGKVGGVHRGDKLNTENFILLAAKSYLLYKNCFFIFLFLRNFNENIYKSLKNPTQSRLGFLN